MKSLKAEELRNLASALKTSPSPGKKGLKSLKDFIRENKIRVPRKNIR
jgi:hypothetical protein